MTTFSYTVVLNDSECIMLEEALKLMVKHCDAQLQREPQAPFFVWRDSAQSVLERLHDNVHQSSGNNFFDRRGA